MLHRDLGEVGVFRYDDVLVFSRVQPDRFIWFVMQAEMPDVLRTREEIGETFDERWRKMMIEQQLHSFATSVRCSRSAA